MQLTRRLAAAAVVAFMAIPAGRAWQDAQSADPGYRLRVSVNLVQVDATVTDAAGKPAPGLAAKDFRVLLDGRPQEIKFCNYIEAGSRPAVRAVPETAVEADKRRVMRPPMPGQTMAREDVRRVVVFFVGDWLTSFESMPALRAGMRKFIQSEMQPGDLVAVVRASAGLGAFQDFTGDRRVLLDAVERVRWTPHVMGMGASWAYTQIGRPEIGGLSGGGLAQIDKIAALSTANLATIASLKNVVRSMADLPGRKSVIILSDSLRLTLPDETDPAGGVETGSGPEFGPIYYSMRGLVDESVRAGVVFYAVDTRGLSSLVPMASDRLKPAEADNPGAGPPPPSWVWDMTAGRRDEYREGQWGGMFLSDATGGFMVTEANRVDAAIERVVEDQRGYYLLAFTPPEGALSPDDRGRAVFRRLRIETTVKGLKVRSHGGFFGIPDEERRAPKTPELRLAAALTSPFQSNELDVDVRAAYLNAKKNHSYLHVAVTLDAKDMQLTGPAVNRMGVFQILVRAFDAKGAQMDGGIDQTLRINLNEEGYERALKWGLVYNGLLPVPKPGAYQVRAACRDLGNGRIGTAADLVDVPKIRGRAPVIGGIILDGSFAVDGHVLPANGPSEFAPGERAKFTFQVMNGAGKMSFRPRLFRDGKEVFAAEPIDTTLAKTAGIEPFGKGEVGLPRNLEPGEYFLRLDMEGAEGPVAWQWTRLRVRPAL